MKSEKVVRQDIIQNLPRNAEKIIAKEVGCNHTYISNVLYGRTNQKGETAAQIINLAQVFAAFNIWNTQFCEHEPRLDPVLFLKNYEV